MRMTDERHAAISAALRRDHSNFNAIAKELGCTWRAVRDVWEGNVADKRPVKEIVDEADKVARSLLAEKDEIRQAEVARIRDGIVADYDQRMLNLDEREARVQRLLAEAQAAVQDTEARAKRLHEARVDHGRADGDRVREQEAMIARGIRQTLQACVALMGGIYNVEMLNNLIEAMRRDHGRTMSGKDAASTIRLVIGSVKPITEAFKFVVEVERLTSGEPTSRARTDVVLSMEPAELQAAVADLYRKASQLEPPDDAVVEEPALPEHVVDTQRTVSDQEPVEMAPAECNTGTAPIQDSSPQSEPTPDEHTEKGSG